MTTKADSPAPSDSARIAKTPTVIRYLPGLSAWIVLSASLLVLLGWALDINGLERLYVGDVTIKTNTALGLALSAGALLLAQNRSGHTRSGHPWARLFASLVVTIGVGTLAEYLFRTNLGIDQLVFRAPHDVLLTPTPGRMAAVTASTFVLLGIALLTLDVETRRGFWPAQPLLVGTAALALTALLGYVYGVIPTAGVGQGIQIAIPTALAFVVLAAGALALRPDDGWVGVVRSPHAGGLLARRLLPFAILVPLALGALRAAGSWTGQLSVGTLSALCAVLTMLAFGVVIWWTATALNRTDARRQEAEHARVALAIQEQAMQARAEADRRARASAEAARAATEQALLEKAAALTLLDVVLASAPVGFALLDRHLGYLRVNDAFARLDGVSTEAYLGRSVSDLPATALVPAEVILRRVHETGEPVVDVEIAVPQPGCVNRSRILLASCYPVPLAGESSWFGIGVFVVEITERKSLEEQLRQSQKMEAVGQLAGGVAHDFNNLLTVIGSYSAMLLEHFPAGATHHEEVQEIAYAADRAAALTRQLLAFSRKQVMQPRPIDLNDVVRNVERMLRRLIGEDIELVTNMESCIDLVSADPGQLEQVLINLAVNARDAMPGGGRLMIETMNAELAAEDAQRHIGAAAGPYVMLAVTDTGSGIPRDMLARIFEPFFTTKERGKGTGLGLSTVYGIVKQSGGDIWVYSEPGHGTTFKIYFPRLGGGDDAFEPTHAAAAPMGGHETVLLVEDDPALCALAERVLTSYGYRMLVARTGPEALALVDEYTEPIHLIATDVVMPGMSGRAVVEHLAQCRPDIRVLFMSGYTDDEVVRRGVIECRTMYVQKPFTPAQLARKVREAIDAPIA